jgi:O-acetylhomoserine/O-acetylserine sulfhydrylase-like pyridoxal-dependent enzyme
MASASTNIDTLVLHGGAYRTDPATGATAVPIYQSTSFNLCTTEHADRLVNFEEVGFVYTRLGNPTQDALEERLAAIEGGAAALALASAQAATALSVLTLVSAGDNIVTGIDLYGGSWNFFANRLRQFGFEARFVDPGDPLRLHVNYFAPYFPEIRFQPSDFDADVFDSIKQKRAGAANTSVKLFDADVTAAASAAIASPFYR